MYQPWYQEGYGQGYDREKLALECGYWNNFRYNPAAEKKFTLDSKAPKMEGYQDFLKGEGSLPVLNHEEPRQSRLLFAISRNEKLKERYEHLSKLVALYGNRLIHPQSELE